MTDPLPPQGEEYDPEVSDPKDNQVVDPDAPLPEGQVKRGRGRPKGSKNKKQGEEGGSGPAQVEKPPSKKRGRPRKVVEGERGGEPKRRGRPPKRPKLDAQVGDEKEKKEKRGRGRPKKSQT